MAVRCANCDSVTALISLPRVRLIETPGHTPQDITTLVETDQGVAALTRLWGYEGAGTDRLAADHGLLDENRLRVLDIATIIVPRHGPMYTVG